MARELTQHLEQAANPEALQETALWEKRQRERRDARLRREWPELRRKRVWLRRQTHDLRPLE